MRIRYFFSHLCVHVSDKVKWLYCCVEEIIFFLFRRIKLWDCIACGRACSFENLCDSCREKLIDFSSFYDKCRCRICGRLMTSETETCMECRENNLLYFFSSVYPIFSYRLWKKELVFAWKTEGQRSLSPLFARILYKYLLQSGLSDLQVVTVPPRPGKIREKGWDQVQDLAFYLKYRYGLKVICPLKRTTVIEQKKLDRKERLSGGLSDYVWDKKFKGNLEKSVVLLDDVITTGATLEKCRQILEKKGVEKVHAAALFRV